MISYICVCLYLYIHTHTHSDIITTIRLVNTTINSCSSRVCVCVLRTFKIYSLSNLEVYNTELLPSVTMLCIMSPELHHHVTRNEYLLPKLSPFRQPPAPGNHRLTLCFYQLGIFRVYM